MFLSLSLHHVYLFIHLLICTFRFHLQVIIPWPKPLGLTVLRNFVFCLFVFLFLASVFVFSAYFPFFFHLFSSAHQPKPSQQYATHPRANNIIQQQRAHQTQPTGQQRQKARRPRQTEASDERRMQMCGHLGSVSREGGSAPVMMHIIIIISYHRSTTLFHSVFVVLLLRLLSVLLMYLCCMYCIFLYYCCGCCFFHVGVVFLSLSLLSILLFCY